jgi:hypothetical protein
VQAAVTIETQVAKGNRPCVGAVGAIAKTTRAPQQLHFDFMRQRENRLMIVWPDDPHLNADKEKAVPVRR